VLENETAVRAGTLVAEAERLRKQGARLVTATGLDEGDHFDVIYHFARDTQLEHLRLSVPKTEQVPSISGVFPGAFLIENEMKELLGVQVTGISVDYGGKLFLVEGARERPLAKQSPNGKAAEVPE
jgi:ech hydrogenase subunit D